MPQINRSLSTRLALGAALWLPPAPLAGATFAPADNSVQRLAMPQASTFPIGELLPPPQRLNIKEEGDELLRIRDAVTGESLVVPRDLLIRPSLPPRGFSLTTSEVRKFLANSTPESYRALLESSPDLSTLTAETRRKLIELLPQIDERFPSQYRTGFYFFMHGGETVGGSTGPGNRVSEVLSLVFGSVKVACIPLAERIDSSLLSENEWYEFSRKSASVGGGTVLPRTLAVPSDRVTAPTAAVATAFVAFAMIGASYITWRCRRGLGFWSRRLLGLPPRKEPPGFEIELK